MFSHRPTWEQNSFEKRIVGLAEPNYEVEGFRQRDAVKDAAVMRPLLRKL